MVVITGGAGFIGSVLTSKLNSEGIVNILIVDDLGRSDKWNNLVKRSFSDYLHKDTFIQMIREDRVPFRVKAIVHLGACTSTTEQDADYLMRNNYRYSQDVISWAVRNDCRFIYASSAATYGDGSNEFSDQESLTKKLRPINIYGYAKQLFDLWILKNGLSRKGVGIRFFNVFGPNEYHKGPMCSMVYKAFHQINETATVKLFKSDHSKYKDGMQLRDFVYVKECAEILWWMLEHQNVSGLFNLGTGTARTWNDLAGASFSAMKRKPQIVYIEMPESIRNHYQYFTEAKMDKLRSVGCQIPFRSLEDAIHDYIENYLKQPDPYL